MHVVVTGASSGIGEAIVREYVRRDALVTLVARRRDLLEKIASEASSGRTHIVQADLADRAHAFTWIDNAERALGPVDVLVNNAGVQIVKGAAETEWSDGERLLLLDLHVPLRLTQIVLRRMIARKEGGAIVDIASMAGLAPTPGMFFYNAAKAGLAAASEGLRAEVKKHGIHVVTVYPGPVTSAMETAARNAYEDTAGAKRAPTGTAKVLAQLVADAVDRRTDRVIYPRVYGLVRHFPNFSRWAVDSFTPPLKRGE